MSFQANRRQSQPDDGGYALPIVIVVIAVGAMVAIALLGYAAALLKAGADDADSLLHLYAADAGIAEMKKGLEAGNLTPPEPFIVGDIEVTVDITPSPTPPAIVPQLPDPLEARYEVIIESVPPDSVLDVHWEFATTTEEVMPSGRSDEPVESPAMSSAYASPSINVHWEYEKLPTSDSCPDSPQAKLRACYKVPGTGDVRIAFDPGTEDVSTTPLEEEDLPPACPNENGTTICVIPEPRAVGDSPDLESTAGESLPAVKRHHVVVSRAGGVTVTAYIRQISQWCLDDSSAERTYERCDDVRIMSWKPYPPDPPNSDDGP